MFKAILLPFVGLATLLLLRGLCSAKNDRSPSETRSELCSLCIDVVGKFQDILEANKSFEDFKGFFVLSCSVALDLTGERGSVMCPGLVKAYGPVIQYVLSERLVDPKVICTDLHICRNESNSSSPSSRRPLTQEQRDKAFLLQWSNIIHDMLVNLPIHHNNMPVLKEGDLKQQQPFQDVARRKVAQTTHKQEKQEDSNTIKILQFSDIHLDHFYAPGSPTDCDLYICCRTIWSGKGSAGHYGAYTCDLPNITLDSLLASFRNILPQPDIVIYTGDNPPHDIWIESFTGQVEATQFLVRYIRNGIGNGTIYPALGNHESFPQSQYYAPKWEYQNLTYSLSSIWQEWVTLGQEQVDTVQLGGYYTMLLEGYPGLRLVAMNTDYGYAANFYTFLNDQNYYYNEHQKWVYNTLENAKKNGEKVLLVGHVPPCDTSSTSQFGAFILDICRRYEETIVGILMAHTHQDQFNMVKDDNGVYGTVLISPSVTPFLNQNPSYRVFEMDRKTYKLLDYHQYHMNLTKANELYEHGIEPEWELMYSAREMYGLKDLTPASWAGLLERMKHNDTLVDWYHYNRYGRSKTEFAKCDIECRHTALCEIENVIVSDMYDCFVL